MQYFCWEDNLRLEPVIIAGIGVYKCLDCQTIYVSQNMFNIFLDKLKESLITDQTRKYSTFIDCSVPTFNQNNRNVKLKGKKYCCVFSCHKNCHMLQIKFHGFNFSYCVKKRSYGFTMKDFKKFFQRRLFWAKLKYIIETVKNLFIRSKNVKE